jgi:hypothetical protein
MRRILRPSLLLLVVLALAGAAAPSLAAPDDAPRIYRWVDSDGIAHYTTDPERIPAALRGRLPEAAAAPATPRTPALPRTTDVWAERDRPADATPIDELDDDFSIDDPAREARIDEIDAQIETLLVHIASDEETLKERVVGAGADPLSSGDDAELRTIAARLPGLLAELSGLRAERATLEAR